MGRRPTAAGAKTSKPSSREVRHLAQSVSPTLMQPDTFASMHRCSCHTSGSLRCHCCRPRARWSPSAPSSCTARRTLATLSMMACTRWWHSSMATQLKSRAMAWTLAVAFYQTMPAVLVPVWHSPRHASRWSSAVCRPCISTTPLTALSVGRIALETAQQATEQSKPCVASRLHGAGVALEKVESRVRHFGGVPAFPVQNAAVLQT